MYDWLRIALGAYLIGALIEGVITAAQLSRSLPEIVKSAEAEDETPDAASPPTSNWSVFVIIAAVSVAGAFSWPCRLIHRSLKDCHLR
jgi:hypothetical protein